MSNLNARLRVILSAAPTYLVALGAILSILVDELAPYAAASQPVEWIIRILGLGVTITGVAVVIVRRSAAVLPSERGLLPPPAPGQTQSGRENQHFT